VGGLCSAGVCAPTCTDKTVNNGESDVDCGGMNCAPCPSTKTCMSDGDCASGKCAGNVCVDVVVISEVRTRGAVGGSDEFIELYNAGSAPATLDASWKIEIRSAASSPCASGAVNPKWTGSGQVVPAHGHLLIATGGMSGYAGPPMQDVTVTLGLTDASSVALVHGMNVADALCFYFNATSQMNLAGCPGFCEGTPISNLPHNNASTVASNVNVSLIRKPGGAGGNAVDTNDNAADFISAASQPESLSSAPVP
jgi:hypothetical protein